MNMPKVHFIQQEAWKRGKRVHQVDIDLKSIFNIMSQAAPSLQVTRIFTIPDVDVWEQIHEDVTVRLAPNNKESATIAFNTGVAQGSITLPQLFKSERRQPARWEWLSIQHYRVHRWYINLCWHSRRHAKAAKRCARIYGLVWYANQCEKKRICG